ncbi:MAG: 16S rRNA (uracil(1498)-N(3))-methyltransferase [Sporomusaceae bacterium]|nr:16S rRNA (uracil(1498)-N(3))-methyltransferase [Sporomusaceae bacterium]
MRRFFLPQPIESGSLVSLSVRDSRHISQVLRLKAGTAIEIAAADGRVGLAKIEQVEHDCVTASVESLKTGGAEPPVCLFLAQGLPKADKMEFIIQKAVELGVSQLMPMQCERSVVRYDDRKAAARVERWQAIAREAAKQAKRDCVPAVAPVQSLSQLLQACPAGTVILLLYEAETALGLRQVLREQPAASYLLLVGPEGGFSRDEVELCLRHGARSVTLGPRILRTETASLAAASIIMYELGDLGGLPWRE